MSTNEPTRTPWLARAYALCHQPWLCPDPDADPKPSAPLTDTANEGGFLNRQTRIAQRLQARRSA